MKRIVYKLIISSLLIGIVLTLITGLFSQPDIVGANWWGYPLTWLTQAVLSPEFSAPLNINWLNLIIDIIIWTVISLVILLAIFRKRIK